MTGRQPAREPLRVGEVLASAVGRDPAEVEVMVIVFSRWDDLVGAKVARHSKPLRLEGDSLVVGVDQGTWATQVRVLSGQITTRLRAATRERVRSIQVVSRPPDSPRSTR